MTDPLTLWRAAACPICRDNGIVIDPEAGTWDVCPKKCWAARDFEGELRKGEADIKAGRLRKWSDVRREL